MVSICIGEDPEAAEDSRVRKVTFVNCFILKHHLEKTRQVWDRGRWDRLCLRKKEKHISVTRNKMKRWNYQFLHLPNSGYLWMGISKWHHTARGSIQHLRDGKEI